MDLPNLILLNKKGMLNMKTVFLFYIFVNTMVSVNHIFRNQAILKVRLQISCWTPNSSTIFFKKRFVVMQLTPLFKNGCSTRCVLGTVLSTGDTAMHKTDRPSAPKNKFQIDDIVR